MRSHDEQVNQQFGQVAAAYLTSKAHAQGADLEALATLTCAHPNARVLDLGCGAGHVSFAVAPNVANVVAYDLSDEMLAVVAKEAAQRGLSNLQTRQGVVESLPFEADSFDFVLTRFSAHHWSDLPKALSEMRRVLKPGGTMIVIDVIAPDLPLIDTHLQCIELLRDVSHVRNYAYTEWQQQLERAGLRIDGSEKWKLPLNFDAWVTRMRTPSDRVAVIRGLLRGAPQEVRDYLSLQEDDSFAIDVAMFRASIA